MNKYKFSLIREHPVGFGMSREKIMECMATDFKNALTLLEPYSPVMLNKNGIGTYEDEKYTIQKSN